MKVIVQCLGSASGRPLGVEGQYLKSYDLEAYGGQGFCDFTKDPAEAMRFDDLAAFHRAYSSTPRCRSMRPDGKPNRPLTATHWEIIPVES